VLTVKQGSLKRTHTKHIHLTKTKLATMVPQKTERMAREQNVYEINSPTNKIMAPFVILQVDFLHQKHNQRTPNQIINKIGLSYCEDKS